jgi:hypothetical protein
VTDGTFAATVTVEIALNGVNDNAPLFTAAGPFSVDEDSAVGTAIGAVAAVDDDVDPAGTLTFSEASGGAGETALDIDPVTGVITVEDPAAFDRELSESVLYDIQVTDGLFITSVMVTVGILGVNDNPPEFDFTGPFAIDENSASGSAVGAVTASDADLDDLTFSESVGGAGESTFAIDPVTGAITVEDPAALDRESVSSLTYDIEVSDGVFTAAVTVTVNINGVNDNAPVFESGGPFAIDENSPAGAVVGVVSASDLDVVPADSLVFAEAAGGAGESTFSIDPVSGAITVEDPAALDRESGDSVSYDIQVTDGLFTAVATVVVSLNGLNDNAPLFTASGPFSLEENSAVGTVAGNVAATDDDVAPADSLFFSEVAGGAGSTALDIDPVTGAITVADPAAFDREVAETVLYDIQVTDGTFTASLTVTVEILGANDNLPAFDFIGPFAIDENSPVGSAVGVVAASDGDFDDLVFSEPTGGAGESVFSIDPSTGVITVEDPSALDRETVISLLYDIQVSDGTFVASVTVTVNVNGVNDNAPVFESSGPFTIEENSPAGTLVGALTATDGDIAPADALTFSELAGGLGESVFSVDPITGEITVENPSGLDRESADAVLYEVLVSDGLFETLSTVTFNIAGVNDNAPSFISAGPFSLAENSAVGALVGSVTADDEDTGPEDTLTFAETPGGAGESTFAIDPVTGEITVEDPSALDREATDVLSYEIQVSDGAFITAVTVVIELDGVSDNAPVADGQNVETEEGVPVVIVLTASDTDIDPTESLTFSVSTAPANGSLSAIVPLSDVSAQVTYTPDPGFAGEDSFSFVASDGTSDSAPATVALTVNGINNNPPAFTFSGPFEVDEGSTTGTVVGTVTATDDDLDALTFAETPGGAGESVFAIDPETGEITVEDPSALDRESVESLLYDIRVTDGFFTAVATVTVGLTGLNDNPPVFTFSGPLNVDENSPAGTVVGVVTATDADLDPAGALAFSEVPGGAGDSVFAIDPATGEITVEDPAALDREAGELVAYDISVSDGAFEATVTVTVNINGVNDNAPLFAFTGPFSIDEGSPSGAVIGGITASDDDGALPDALVFSEVPAGAGEAVFAIDPATGQITVEDATALDRETVASLTYDIQVSDGLFIASASVIIDIAGVNDNAPVFTTNGPFAIDENSAVGAVVGTVAATDDDIDPADTLTFAEVAGGDGIATLAIDPASGEITVEDPAALDSESAPSVLYDIQVTDGFFTTFITVTVAIDGTNDNAPLFTGAGPFSLDENSPAGTAIGIVTATDADLDELTFAEAPGGAGESVFAIDPVTGEITVEDPSALDREAVDSLTYDIEVTDGIFTASATVAVALNGLNDNAPVFTFSGPFSVDENSPAGAAVGSAVAADTDVGPADTLTFSEIPGGVGESVFSIDPVTGEITVEDPAALDRELAESLIYDIQITDGVFTNSVTVTVGINGTNDQSPAFTFAGPFSVDENGLAGTAIGTVTAEDADVAPADVLTYSEVPGGSGESTFAIDPVNGEITVEDAAALDRETVEALAYDISVSDGANVSAVTVTVNITGLNDNAPAFAFSGPFAVDENSPAGTTVGSVTAADSDIDPADALVFTEASGGAGESVFSIDPATGEITVEDPAALDRETAPSAIYDIQVTDGLFVAAVTVTIDISGINDNAPAFTFSGPFAVDENSPAGATVGSVAAADADVGPADTLTYSETPGGAGESVFSIDPATGEITVEDPVALDRESIASLLYEIQVTDGSFAIAVTVTVNLNGVNDEQPAFTVSGPFAINENSSAGTVVGAVAATDADVAPSGILSFAEASGGAGESIFAIDPVSGEITVEDAAALDREAAESLFYDIEVTDGVFVTPITIEIGLIGINDNTPVADAQSVETEENEPVVITLTGSDLDVDPSQAFIFAIATAPSNGSLSAITQLDDTSAQVTYTPDEGFTGADSFSFTVSDGEFTSAAALVSVTVTSLNDHAPVFTFTGPFTIDENSPAATNAGTVTATDEDLDTLVFSEAPGGSGQIAFDIDPSTGEIVIADAAALDRESVESVSYDIQVSDGVFTTVATVTVTLSGLNDNSPLFTFTGPFSVDENSAPGASAGAVTAADADVGPAEALVFSEISGGAGESVFEIDPVTGEITVEDSLALDRELVGSFEYDITVSDGIFEATVTVTVGINGVSDIAPAFTETGPFLIDENSPAGTDVGAVTATDDDTGPTDVLVFTEVSGGAGESTFSIDAITGEITVEDPAALDRESVESVLYEVSVSDGTFLVPVTVTVNLNGLNDNLPEADGLTLVTDEDEEIVITLIGDDLDIGPTDVLELVIDGQPVNGSLSEFTVLDDISVSVTYTPAADFNGSDSFTFTVSDGTDISAPATVAITVRPVNDAPVADSQSLATDEDTPIVVTLTASDMDGQPLIFVIDTFPANGSLSTVIPVDDASATVTYTPDTDFAGTDSFTFLVFDGVSPAVTGTVDITVGSGANDAPVITFNGPFNIAENSPAGTVVGQVTAFDLDLDELTFQEVATDPRSSIFAIDPITGEITVEDPSALDRETVAVINYQVEVTDGIETVSASVLVFIDGINDNTPTVNGQQLRTRRNTPIVITLTATDLDIDPTEELSCLILSGPLQGTLSSIVRIDDETFQVTYTPDAGFQGDDTFTFAASDGSNTSEPGVIRVRVRGAEL